MTFPTIPTTGAGRVLTGTQADTSQTRTFPSLSGLTKNSGDLLIAIVIGYQSSATANAVWSSWGGGFTELTDQSTSSTLAVGVGYKWSTGSETGTFTVTEANTVTGHAAFILLSIPGVHATTAPFAGTRATGTTAAADPGSINPSLWDVEDTLWIAIGGAGETATGGSFDGITAAPTNYSNLATTAISGDVVGGVQAAVAFRQNAAASEDAGPFTLDVSNARSAALVIAVRPTATLTQTLGLPATVESVHPIVPTGDYVRDFDGADDNQYFPPSIALESTTYGTIAVLVKPETVSGLRTFFSMHDSSNVSVLQCYLDADEISYYNGTAVSVSSGANVVPTANRWYLIVVRKATGNVAPRYSVYDTTAATWTHGSLPAIDNHGAPSSGGYLDFSWQEAETWNGRVAVRAIWADSLPWAANSTGDAAIEAAGLHTDYPSWVDAAPDGLWKFNQANAYRAIPDETGNGANGATVVGTTAVAEVPTGFAWEAAAGQTVVLGCPETTDTPARLATGIGAPSTTDEAHPITATKTATLGQPSVTDEPLAVAKTKTRTLGVLDTTETAQAVTKTKTATLGQPQATDEAHPVSHTRTGTLGLAETTDTPLPVGRIVGLDVVDGTDEALAITATQGGGGQIVTLGTGEDSALAHPVTKTRTVTLGVAEATDTAQPVTKTRTVALGLATETALAHQLGRARTLGQPSATDTAQPAGKAKTATLGQPGGTDTAHPVGKTKTRTLGLPSGTDTAEAIGRARTLGVATGTDTAHPITTQQGQQTITLGCPETTDEPQRIGRARRLGQPSTTDTPQTVGKAKTRLLGCPETTDTLHGIGRARRLGLAETTDTPHALTRLKTRTLGLASATDTAHPVVVFSQQLAILGLAETTEDANPISSVRSGRLVRVDNYHQHRTGGQLRRYDGATLRSGGALRRWTGTTFHPPRE